MSQLLFSTWFSCGQTHVAPTDAVVQTVRADNQFNTECLLEIESRLVIDDDETPVDSATLAYDGMHVHFRQTVIVGAFQRKKKVPKGPGAPPPNPLDVERDLVVGTPPAGQARPYQVFGHATSRATVPINGKPRKNAVWEKGYEARDSVLIA